MVSYNSINTYDKKMIFFLKCAGVGGVTVSMVAFQAVDPGSIPGRRILFL